MAYGVPGEKNGYEIALYTSLAVYCEVFQLIHYITLCSDTRAPKLPPNTQNVYFHHIDVPQRSIYKLFLRSLSGQTPACVLRFTTGSVLRKMRYILQSIAGNSCPPTHVVYEDIPVGCLAMCIHNLMPGAKSAVRSHNVLQNSFRGMERMGGVISRAAWWWELLRIRRFEGHIVHSIPTVWSITEEDMSDYQRLYGRHVDGVLGVGIETGRYRDVAPGKDCTVLHIGGLDTKRGLSMRNFIRSEWLKVRSQVPEAQLLLAGMNSERFADESIGVVGCGEVQSDVEFLNRGRVFINTQEVGSGVKLKSVIAMAAGKALISTENGIQGIPATPGTHFLRTDGVYGMAEHIVRLLLQKNLADRIAKAAQAFVFKHYDLDLVMQRGIQLVEEWKSCSY